MQVLVDFVAHLKNIDPKLYSRAANIGIDKAISKRKANLESAIKWLTSINTQLEKDYSEKLSNRASKHLNELKERKRQVEIKERLDEIRVLLKKSKSIKFPDTDYINKQFWQAEEYEYWNTEKEDSECVTLKTKRFVGQGDDWVTFTNGYEIIHEIDDLLHRYSEYKWEIKAKDDDEENLILMEIERLLNLYQPLNGWAEHIDEFELYGWSLSNLFEQYMCTEESEYWEGFCISGNYRYAFINKKHFKPCLIAFHYVHQNLCDWTRDQLLNN